MNHVQQLADDLIRRLFGADPTTWPYTALVYGLGYGIPVPCVHREIMDAAKVDDVVADMRTDTINAIVATSCPPGSYPEQWDVPALRLRIAELLALDLGDVFDDEGHGFSKKANEIRGFKAIVNGEYDHLPEQAFYMVGGIDEAVEKAKKMAAS